MIYYFDSSVLGKLFFAEAGSDQMRRTFEPLDTPAKVTSAVSGLEFRSIVRRRQRAGEIPLPDADDILAAFTDEWLRISVQPLNQVVLDLASQIMDRRPLRALDAIHLGSCLATCAARPNQPVLFVCSDRTLTEAAAAEGVETFDPTE